MDHGAFLPQIDGHIHPLRVAEAAHLMDIVDAVQAEQSGLWRCFERLLPGKLSSKVKGRFRIFLLLDPRKSRRRDRQN
jgi:hypothetical protein